MTRSVGAGLNRRSVTGLLLAAIALAAGVAAWAAWGFAHERTLRSLSGAAAAKLTFTTETLAGDFGRYKLLAKALSQTAAVRRRTLIDVPGGSDEAAELLDRMTGISGAAEIRFLTGATAASAAEKNAIGRAYQGIMGLAFDQAGGGAFLFAAPVWRDSQVAGAILVSQFAAELEFSWRALPETVFFTGEGGTIRLASAPALRGRTLHSDAAPLPDPGAFSRDGRTFWRLDGPEWARLGVNYSEAMLVTRPAPAIDLNAFLLVDAAPAREAAWLAAAAAAAIVLALGLIVMIVLQRRAALAARLALEERANAELELKVADRTVELTAEIDERRAVTRRLRDAQEDLVQAGKLAALGRMAAGIAHEINQPLAAIRNFAENAVVLSERGRDEEARANLGQIADLTDRAARIIRNLRAFARNEAAETAPVSVADAVEGALTILSPRIREANAQVDWTNPPAPVHVTGGLVRLQQVVINLVANALDAQAGADEPCVEITLDQSAATVSIAIRDHGPGLSPEAQEKLFEPFYSGGGAGKEAGLGLGLSISYGIIRSFGGDLKGGNHPEGGALFTVRLRRAEAPRAAA